MMDKAIKNLQRAQEDYKREEGAAEEKIFAYLNTADMIDQFIDIHGQKIAKGNEIAFNHLKRLSEELSSGKVKPNLAPHIHIYKIICGAGSHSNSGKGMMKQKLKENLEQ